MKHNSESKVGGIRKRFLVFTLAFLTLFIFTNLVSAELGLSDPDKPKLEAPEAARVASVNYSTVNVNNSDTVDNYHASAFAKLNEDNTFTATNKFKNLVFGDAPFQLILNQSQGLYYERLGNRYDLIRFNEDSGNGEVGDIDDATYYIGTISIFNSEISSINNHNITSNYYFGNGSLLTGVAKLASQNTFSAYNLFNNVVFMKGTGYEFTRYWNPTLNGGLGDYDLVLRHDGTNYNWYSLNDNELTVDYGSIYANMNLNVIGNVTANNLCYSNGTNCVASSGGNSSFNQSLTDSLYYPRNTNPNGYYNVTTLPASASGNPFNQVLNTTSNVAFNSTQIGGSIRNITIEQDSGFEVSAYTNAGGTGDRRSTITLTNTLSISGTANLILDGTYGYNPYFAVDGTPANKYLRFNFTTPKVITEVKWYQDLTTTHAWMIWQGSNDASSWTNLTVPFRLGGATTQTQTGLSGNTNGYIYYQMIAINNTYPMSNANYITEIEFKIAGQENFISFEANEYSNHNGTIWINKNGGLTKFRNITADNVCYNDGTNCNTTGFITYTGATTNVNLNLKNLTNVANLAVGSNSLVVGGTTNEAIFRVTKDITSRSGIYVFGENSYGYSPSANDVSYQSMTGTSYQLTKYGNFNVSNSYDQFTGFKARGYVSNAGWIDWITGASFVITNDGTGTIGNGVALGVNSPSGTGRKTNVYGIYMDSQKTASNNVSGNAYSLYSAGASDEAYLQGNLRVINSTNLGTLNASSLTISGGSGFASQVFNGGSGGAFQNLQGSWFIDQQANAPIYFRTNGANYRMTVEGDGDVCIGQTTCSSKLSVDGTTFIGNTTANVTIDNVNGLRMYGTSTVYNDVVAPMTISKIGAGVTAPSFDENQKAYGFADGVNEQYAFVSLQLPHSYKPSTNIYCHLHVRPDGTQKNNVTFEMNYSWYNIGEPSTTTTGLVTVSQNFTSGVALNNTIIDFGGITGTGKKESSTVAVKLTRKSNVASDTYTGSVYVDFFDCHHEMEKLGTNNEYT